MNTNVSLGATVSFRVYASSTNLPLTYQWQHEGTNLPGTTNATLVLTNVSVAHAGGYVAWITNASSGFTNSRTATLTVDTTFTKITQGPIVNDRLTTWYGRWGDYDRDGRLDLLVTGYSGKWRLYHNDGGAMFSTVTNGVMGEYNLRDMWGIWADLDNDDDLDIFAGVSDGTSTAGVSIMNMFWNDGGGNFTRVPVAGWGGFANGGAWGDFDQDGFIDAAFFGALEQGTNALLHNNGDGTLTKVTNSILNIRNDTVHLSCAVDYDNDGDLDLVPVRWGVQPTRFYRNDGHGTFTEATPEPIRSELTYSLSAAWGDFDNDGDLDVFFGGYDYTTERFYINNGDGTFTRWAGQPALFESYGSGNGSCVGWGDFDNDGYLDLAVTKGPAAIRLWRNRGDGSFAQVLTGSLVNESGSDNQSGCWVDFNQDGNLDFFVATLGGGVDKLFMGNGNGNHWLEVKPKGIASNRQAVGAKIFATANIRGQVMRQMRVITASDSDESLIAHFGLGDATNVDLVRIEWPSGNVQELANVAPNQIITVTEATLITPPRPSASLNGSVTLTRSFVSGATYQWRLDGVDLVGQTNRILNLTNVVAGQEGRYSVVGSNATTLVTNFVYLHVDTQFTKITQGAIVNDLGSSYVPSWGDYNGDGWLDLFVANGGNEGPTIPFLYRNDQQGGFVRVAAAEVGTLATDAVQACEGCWADYDNDGDQDLFIGSLSGPDRLYVNEGNGRFTRVTQDVGINRALPPWGSAWADYDNDGFVDLYLASGWISAGTRDSLWRNSGDGSFRQSQEIPFRSMDAYFGTWGDADNDGDLDLLVGGGAGGNAFYRNNGDGTFTDDLSAGLVGSTGLMPVWADFNNDGYLDVFRASSTCNYYLNNKDGTFQRITTGPHTTIGGIIASAGDYDNDGDLDLFITRGVVSGDPSLLLRNEGDGTFVSITCGSLTQDRGHFGSCAWADYDNDGALDLVVSTEANEKNALFHNNGNSNGWLIVRPVGTRSNRDAIGAKVRASATVGGRSTLQTRQIGGGALGDPRAHFGLGNATKVTTLRIEWPSGAVQELKNVAANQILTVYEPPAMAAAVRVDGACELTIKAEPHRGWQIQASSDLLTWQTLTTVTNTSYQFLFADPAVAGLNYRFYRVESE